jgi:hypothetical protein
MLTLASITLHQTRRLPQTSRNHTRHVSAFISSTLLPESHSLPEIMLSQVQQMSTTHYVNLGRYITRNLVGLQVTLFCQNSEAEEVMVSWARVTKCWVTRNTHRILAWKSPSKLCHWNGWGNLRITIGRKGQARKQISVALTELP